MNNKKAFNKRPYVLHVDGLAKAKGIHKHVWRAALRGQCGHLDPTMDNINHHPKHVVDNIWQSLEKEWEFEGFSHRAKEMFERSATKLMWNKKMQLKYKCQKIVDNSKPDDVIEMHWKKIVKATKKETTLISTEGMEGSCSKGKEKVVVDREGDSRQHEEKIDMHDCHKSQSAQTHFSADEEPEGKADDVDAKIRSLQSELLRLQKSRELRLIEVDKDVSGGQEEGSFRSRNFLSDKVAKSMKENVQLVDGDNTLLDRNVDGKNVKDEGGVIGPLTAQGRGTTQSNMVDEKEKAIGLKDSDLDVKQMEMDCGDLVRVFAYIGGRKEEIGKAIVMGLSGSKFAKKTIPPTWQSIKITSCTQTGASKICPFPPGWVEQLKSKTVKEVNKRIILWPDMLLQPL